MMVQAQFTIYSHYDEFPEVVTNSFNGSHWVDVKGGSGVLLTIHCSGSGGVDQAERAAAKLREAFAIARELPQAATPIPVVESQDVPVDVVARAKELF